MNLYLLLLISAVLHLAAAWVLLRHLRQQTPPAFHRVVRIADKTRTRGHALIEAIAVLALCAVIAAALIACLSDIDLLTLNP